VPPLAGWFDFNPVHGSGSGGNKEFLDEQWEAQQAILRARRGESESLKQKYKEKQKFQVASSVPPPVTRGDGMYFASNESPTKKAQQAQAATAKKSPPPAPQAPSFKFPWDK
jgi:murein L,D-transpeptidase YafK